MTETEALIGIERRSTHSGTSAGRIVDGTVRTMKNGSRGAGVVGAYARLGRIENANRQLSSVRAVEQHPRLWESSPDMMYAALGMSDDAFESLATIFGRSRTDGAPGSRDGSGR